MNRLHVSILAAILLLSTTFFDRVFARTCTAPGHPTCTITCDDGCAVLYEEPDGPCRSMCSGDDDALRKTKKRTHSIDAKDLTAQQIRSLLQKHAK
jgi:hypothetical protein